MDIKICIYYIIGFNIYEDFFCIYKRKYCYLKKDSI